MPAQSRPAAKRVRRRTSFSASTSPKTAQKRRVSKGRPLCLPQPELAATLLRHSASCTPQTACTQGARAEARVGALSCQRQAQPRATRPRRRAAVHAAAARGGGNQQPARAGNQPRAMHWGPRRGRRAAALGRRRRGWAQRWAGRCAHGGGLVGRARGRAGRQNAGSSPAHPTSLFSPPSVHGEPRHAGRSAS